ACLLTPPLFVEMSEADSSSGFAGSVENGTFLELFPTSLSTSVDSSSGHLSNVYIYVSIFLSLLAFLLLLLIIALQRLKNIISSSSSYPEYPSDAGSSFTNLEVCSISSQRSTFSNLSS
ncbi:RIKEN cDNA 6030405A18, isoform CRA_a, partial [Mus musculus]